MKKILIGVLAVGLWNCQGGSEEALKLAEAALMEGHDVVMPKSMMLGELKDSLVAKLDSSNAEQLAKATDIARRLDQAEAAMYTWMESYQVVQQEVTDPLEKLKRWQTMKSQIDSIAVATDQVIADAKAF